MALNKIYMATSLTGWIARSIAALSQISVMPLLLDKLGVSGYATYVVIALAGSWISLCDFGLANALQNLTSKAIHLGNKLEEIEYYSVTLVLIVAIISTMVGLLYLAIGSVAGPLGVYFQLNGLIFDTRNLAIAYFIFTMQGLGNIGQKVLFARQKGWVAYLLISSAQLVGVILTYIYIPEIAENKRIEYSIIFNFGLPALLMFCVTISLLSFSYLHITFDKFKRVLREISKLSTKFFTFSIVAQSILGIDLIILSSLKNVNGVSDYAVAQRVFGIPLAFYSVILSAWWPNITRSWEEGKIYNQRTIGKINIIFGVVLTITTWFIFFFNIFNINFYLFGGDIKISGAIWSLLLIYILIRIWTDTFSIVLLATNRIRVVTTTAIAQALISVPLQIYLGITYGVVGLIVGISLSFLLTVSWVFPKYCLNLKYSNK